MADKLFPNTGKLRYFNVMFLENVDNDDDTMGLCVEQVVERVTVMNDKFYEEESTYKYNLIKGNTWFRCIGCV